MGVRSLDKDILKSSIGNQFLEDVIDAYAFFKIGGRTITVFRCCHFAVIFEINRAGDSGNRRL